MCSPNRHLREESVLISFAQGVYLVLGFAFARQTLHSDGVHVPASTLMGKRA
jgi:hypothetical protein